MSCFDKLTGEHNNKNTLLKFFVLLEYTFNRCLLAIVIKRFCKNLANVCYILEDSIQPVNTQHFEDAIESFEPESCTFEICHYSYPIKFTLYSYIKVPSFAAFN